jgi:hypothetical protein
VNPGDERELILSKPKNILSDVFEGIHDARYILTSIYCQYACANLFYARRNVMV